MSVDKSLPPYVAHFAGNQVPSGMGVEGTLGTADLGGTARVLPIGVDPSTGAQFFKELPNDSNAQIGTSFVVLGTTGAGVWGTIIAASGAGTKQFISGLSIIVHSGTVDCAITTIGVGGSVGAGVLARGQFVPSGGIARDYTLAKQSGTNGTVAYWMGGAGTATFQVDYWQSV